MSFSFASTATDPHGTHHSSPNSMHPQQYVASLPGSSSSSTGGSPTASVQVQAAAAAAAAAQAAVNMPLLASIANVKDSRWLTLEVCREYQRGKCTRSEQECKFAHPPTHVEVNSGKVIACFDSLKGKCNRTNPPCKYLHPPQHLRDILLQNGRNNLILRSIAMNIAANQSMYPQTAAPLPYPNGAMIQNHLQQTASLPSYHHIGPTAPGQSTLLFNPAGQAFSIPLHAAHLQHLPQATTGTHMFSSDGAQYFQPVTQLAAQATGQKAARTDRLEVYPNSNSNHDALKSYPDLDVLYQQQTIHEDDGAYANGFASAYQPYPGSIQTIYTKAPSIDLKDSTFITSTNGDTIISNGSSSSSSSSSSSGVKPSGAQIIAAPQFLQQQSQQQQHAAVMAQQQKRSAIADPKTGIPMAAYPLTAFSYPSPSPLPIQLQQPYLTAVPMAFAGYTTQLPRL